MLNGFSGADLDVQCICLQALCLLFEELQLYGGSLVTPRSLPPQPGGSTTRGKPQQERRKALEHLVAHHVRAADQVPPPPPPHTPTQKLSPQKLSLPSSYYCLEGSVATPVNDSARW